MSRDDKIQMISLLQEKADREYKYRYKVMYAGMYEWQKEFIKHTAEYTEVCLCAANRIGKTYLGTYVDAIHLMGDYPEGWEGHVFDKPPTVWALGYSGEKTRDLLQRAIIGIKTDTGFDGGLVPNELIESYESMTGTPGAMRTVRVKHKSGGVSTIQFWSYSQGQHALMGDNVDFFHIDEEPKDQSIHPQVLTRTATGDSGRGGRGILTFTPENGRTELVISFMDRPGKGQVFMQKGWNDAPHLSEKVKETLLESFPPHQRDMRTKGIPMLGHGRIYDMSEEFITCAAFTIPDHWLVINGMDFGWDHPQSHIQLAFDPDDEIFYLTHAIKIRQTTPENAWGAIKKWATGVPTAWPHDGLNSEKSSGDAQKTAYVTAGFRMLPKHTTFPSVPDGKGGMRTGGNGVEAGLFEIRNLMQSGKFKVFDGLRDFFEEFNQYHRNENGKIVKVRDDILDALRYAYMMRRYAIRFGDVKSGTIKKVYIPRPIKQMGRR